MWKRVYDWPARHRIQKTIKFDGICTRAGRKRKNVSRIKQPAGRKVLFGGKKWNVTRRRFLSADHHPIGDSGPIFYRLRPLPHILSGGHRNFPLSSLFPRFSSFPASSQALIPLFFSLSLSLSLAFQFLYLSQLWSPPPSHSHVHARSSRENWIPEWRYRFDTTMGDVHAIMYRRRSGGFSRCLRLYTFSNGRWSE